ncbi:MAG TPA: terpene cyclase/mutase family protein, partial [Myxococcales bacterium]|nr:terpene cyclase/mutase family protein [Myxococcales bacterium]
MANAQPARTPPAIQPQARSDVREALRRALGNLERLQGDDGAWPGDYGGPMFLLPMYLALCHAAGELPDAKRRAGMIRYFASVQHADGSLGLHAEDPRGTMFTSALGYVALRVLGLPPEDPRLARMRSWIHAAGTPLTAASWGKFTLCLLGLYDWRGIHPLPPELWLLPDSAPLHPGRLWCHCRQVYLPMAWLYGRRATVPPDALIEALRAELYGGKWATIAWAKHRDTAAPADSYRPPTPALQATQATLDAMERLALPPLRRKALAEVFAHILYEDQVTNYVDIGPVNKVLNAFVHHFESPGGEHARRSFAACEEYLWDGHDGVKMQGYNSSKLWDTAFAVQAVLAAAPIAGDERPRLLEKAHGYLRDNQILDDVPEPEHHYRHRSKGGWPFSNRRHGWPITDCTAEGYKCALALAGRFEPVIPEPLLRESVKLLLSWQNEDGGWATYERQRGGAWLELLNPSQVFGDIMVDYSYVECTSAALQALAAAQRRDGRAGALVEAIARGERFIRGKQLPDGSFEGSWAVCFTYGTWFGVTGLRAAGAGSKDRAIRQACDFLLGKQHEDGSWGEHGDSCREHRWVDAPGTVVQTAWALSTLMRAEDPDRAAQERAARFLLAKQAGDGGWAREPLVGVFNRTCLINYDNYRHYFPLWAL